ncbi:g8034 [Coccomyxa viridis]|uniref:G8034 protein n=1 Tax=Coccomyxa viridis TaxID=1274662 RepID=A0ABP1G1Z3_9CHLO
MNPADFRGLYFYKLLIPAFTWGSILGTFLGPFFFPAAWFLFVAAFMVVFVLVSLSQLWRMLGMISRIQQTIARSVPVTKAVVDECEQRQRCWRGFSRKKVLQAGSLEAGTAANGDAGKQIALDISVPFLHAFVIPNYKEPMSVLKSTLQQLADHKTAVDRYLIVLAMEVAEDGHEAKAQKLSEDFKGRFKHILWTSHRQKLGEMRGKASNVDWAAREAAKEFKRLSLDTERIMLTNMDADAQVPALYVQEVDRAAAAAEDPHLLVYAAPILFERNAYDVPVFTRVHDFMWSAMAMQNLGSPMQLGFPISNYTMSLALLERIDFWDTSEDAIGEDFHMFVKAYFKTHGQVRLAAIPSPVNMLNLQAGGYWETIRARMVQAERHARGCADFAYCLKHARSMPHFSWRTVALCFKVLEAQMLPACAPFYMGLAAGWGVFISKHVQHSALSLMGLNFIKLFGLAGIPIFVSLAACNEVVRRYVRPRLYNTKNMPLWRCADYVALLVDVWLFMVLPTVFALTKSILPISQGEYVVAEKIVTEEEEKVLLIGPLSSGSLHSMGTHDSSSSLDWALDAAGSKEQVGEVVMEMNKAGLGVEVHTRPRGTHDWRETPASEVLDARALKAAAQAVQGPPPPLPVSTPTWVDTPAQLPSTNGQAPIRSRACVSRSTSNASPSVSSVVADARLSPSRDSTPRKADRPEIAKFFSGWMSPVMGSLRA